MSGCSVPVDFWKKAFYATYTLKTLPTDTRNQRHNQLSIGRAEADRLTGGAGFRAHTGQGLLAIPVVRKFPSMLIEHGAGDLTEAAALVRDAGFGGRQQDQRWCIRGVGNQGFAGTSGQHG